MKMTKKIFYLIMVTVLTGSFLHWTAIGFTQENRTRYQLPEGVYINLTEDFYRALREGSDGSTTTYRTNQSEEYLRQIAVSTKFMVESNFQILKQQEQLIRLLEALNKKRK